MSLKTIKPESIDKDLPKVSIKSIVLVWPPSLSFFSNKQTSYFLDKKNDYDYSFLMEARFLDQDTRRKWYKRVFQVPMIVDDKYSYFFDKENKTKIMTYSSFYRFLDENEFLSRFYQ